MATPEEPAALQIIFPEAPTPQVLHVCHRLSAMLGGQEVQIQAPPTDPPAGVLLQVDLPLREADRYWPKVRALLRASDLLEPAIVELRAPTAEDPTRLWPPPGNGS